MRKSKELIILFILLLGAAAGVLGYVINRRAHPPARPSDHAGEPMPPPAGSNGRPPRD